LVLQAEVGTRTKGVEEQDEEKKFGVNGTKWQKGRENSVMLNPPFLILIKIITGR
jgi:hypothetical protein